MCDDYFCDSLEVICEQLDLDEAVAGATFMAAGSSAPELATSLVTVFTTQDSTGLGTILGSAVFNLVMIVCLSGIFGEGPDKKLGQSKYGVDKSRQQGTTEEDGAGNIKNGWGFEAWVNRGAVKNGVVQAPATAKNPLPKGLYLDWRPLARDAVFYVVSLLMCLFFALTSVGDGWCDGKTKEQMLDGEECKFNNKPGFVWWEGLVLTLCYGIYIHSMVKNDQLMEWARGTDGKGLPEHIELYVQTLEAEEEEDENAQDTIVVKVQLKFDGKLPADFSALFIADAKKGIYGAAGSAGEGWDEIPLEIESSASSADNTHHTVVFTIKPDADGTLRTEDALNRLLNTSLEKKDGKCIGKMGTASVESFLCTLGEDDDDDDEGEKAAGDLEGGKETDGLLGPSAAAGLFGVQMDDPDSGAPPASPAPRPAALESQKRIKDLERRVHKMEDDLSGLTHPNKHDYQCVEDDPEEEEDNIVIRILAAPWKVAFMATIPGCQKETFQEWEDKEILFADLEPLTQVFMAKKYKFEGGYLFEDPEKQYRISDGEELEDVPDDAAGSERRKGDNRFIQATQLFCKSKHKIKKVDLWYQQSKRYVISFTMSIVWIGATSWGMVFIADKMGCIMKVNSFIMGLVVLAAGTSIPDALSSVVVAQDGDGDMAVANAIGSNVFNIFLGIGLPMLISPFIYSEPYIVPDGLAVFTTTIMLVVITIIMVAALAMNRWILSKKLSWVLMSMFFIYIGLNIVFDGGSLDLYGATCVNEVGHMFACPGLNDVNPALYKKYWE